MKNNLVHHSFMKLMLSVLAWSLCAAASASDFHSATKDCSPTPCTTTGTGSFAIATPQIVRWSATHTAGPTAGNDFYLSTSGPNMADIAITTSLSSGFNSGEFFLNPGNYFIAINTALMGEGSYTIEYNLVADCSVNPLTFNFGDHDAGSAGDDHGFTISLAGDDLPVTIGAISGTDNTHFFGFRWHRHNPQQRRTDLCKFHSAVCTRQHPWSIFFYPQYHHQQSKCQRSG